MKKIIALIVCAFMLVPCFMFSTGAEDGNDTNIAPLAAPYASSEWNYYSNPRFLNNLVYDHSYEFWRPGSENRGDPIDDKMQYCGFKFRNYYEFNEINIYAVVYAPNNNIKYTVKALIMGEWIELGAGYNNDSVQTTGNEKAAEGSVGKISIKLNDYITTKNIRIECSQYGKYGDGQWWDVPIIQEVEIIGKLGETPEFDVPDGAVLSTNAALSGMAGASSSASARNPGSGNDNALASYWQASRNDAGEYWFVDFDKEYDINNVSVNFGGSVNGRSFTYDISVLSNGTWQTVVSGATASTTEALQENIVHSITPQTASAMRVTFTQVTGGRALLTEAGCEIANEGKCIFLNEYITGNKQMSTAAGNLACYGSAYASSSLNYSGISDIEYINDGQVSDTAYSWFAETRAASVYCGVVLKEAHNVNKVVLYFNDFITGEESGDHVISFDIQVKIGNNYETVASGTSYDNVRKTYIASIEFDEAYETDDVRIVFTSNGLVFPYLKEMEIYEEDYVYGAYESALTDRTKGGAGVTAEFAPKTIVPRSIYLDMISPKVY